MELQCNLTPEQQTVYDSAVQLWRDLRQGLVGALEQTNTTSREVWKPFWSAQQRFFKLLCVSLKVNLCLHRPLHAMLPSVHCLMLWCSDNTGRVQHVCMSRRVMLRCRCSGQLLGSHVCCAQLPVLCTLDRGHVKQPAWGPAVIVDHQDDHACLHLAVSGLHGPHSTYFPVLDRSSGKMWISSASSHMPHPSPMCRECHSSV